MDRQTLIRELQQIIGNYLKQQGLVLVDLIYHYEGRNLVLRVLVDEPEGGISLDTCTFLNQEFSRVLDEKNILQEGYLLEVSSPGIERPLKTKEDFFRCLNRRVRCFLSEPLNGKLEWVGTINKVTPEAVFIERDGDLLKIPLAKINKARREINQTER